MLVDLPGAGLGLVARGDAHGGLTHELALSEQLELRESGKAQGIQEQPTVAVAVAVWERTSMIALALRSG